MKKFHGSWNKVEEVQFQGSAFIISERPKELYAELKQVPKLTKVLGRETDCFFALGENDKKLVKRIGNQEHKTSLSKVLVGGEKQIRVIVGPLKEYVGNIVKMNLHKREAIVEVEFMGRMIELKIGISIISMIDK